MKQCPKCSSTYANDRQKFCTKDGTALVDAHEPSAGQDTTIRIDSTQLDDEITKVISQPLPRMSEERFDPYKTNVSASQAQGTPQPPPPSQLIAPPPVAAPPPPAPPPTVSAPAPASPPTPPPSQPIAPPPTVSASTSANIASQSTSASIAADTVPAVAMPIVPPAASAAALPQPAAPQAKKRSKLPLILGILFVLLLVGAGGLVAGYFFVLKPMLDKKRAVLFEPRPQPTPGATTTPDIGSKPENPKIDAPPYSPSADAVQFVNSNAKLDGKLAEHYVDFSFYYPKTWQKDLKAGVPGASNFARVERRLPPDLTQENFAVGWYSSAGSDEGDLVAFHNLAETLSAQYAHNPDFFDYRKTSEGPTTVGPYKGYEFRFETASHNRKDIKIWGRVIFLTPVDGGKNGVTLLMFATSLASELQSVDDVGVKGELPMMLESFRFGK